MASKNSLLLYNSEFGFFKFSVLHSYDIFNRTEMANLLEAIEDKTYTYDDIIKINISKLLEIKTITDLPRKLKSIEINNTTLETFTIPEQCTDILSITIRSSNLERIPEIHFLTKLTTLNIEKSNIKHLPSSFPPSLSVINLNGNSLNENNCDLNLFPKNVNILLFNNCFTSKPPFPNICYGTQYARPIHKPITNYTIQHGEAYNILRGAIRRTEYDPNPNQPITVNEQDMFNSSQTVHISSICNSVTKSIQKIRELTDGSANTTNYNALVDEFIDEFFNKKNKTNWTNKLVNLFINNNACDKEITIRTWINDASIHSKTNITYKELLARVWVLIKTHEKKKEFIENVRIEIESSIGKCFTGKINRLVNSLVGFIDGITVGISIKEQLQLEIGKIIAKLSKQEIKYEQAVKEITELFEDPDVKEDETVTSYYKQAWLDALEDYKPDEKTDEEEAELVKELLQKQLENEQENR